MRPSRSTRRWGVGRGATGDPRPTGCLRQARPVGQCPGSALADGRGRSRSLPPRRVRSRPRRLLPTRPTHWRTPGPLWRCVPVRLSTAAARQGPRATCLPQAPRQAAPLADPRPVHPPTADPRAPPPLRPVGQPTRPPRSPPPRPRASIPTRLHLSRPLVPSTLPLRAATPGTRPRSSRSSRKWRRTRASNEASEARGRRCVVPTPRTGGLGGCSSGRGSPGADCLSQAFTTPCEPRESPTYPIPRSSLYPLFATLSCVLRRALPLPLHSTTKGEAHEPDKEM